MVSAPVVETVREVAPAVTGRVVGRAGLVQVGPVVIDDLRVAHVQVAPVVIDDHQVVLAVRLDLVVDIIRAVVVVITRVAIDGPLVALVPITAVVILQMARVLAQIAIRNLGLRF